MLPAACALTHSDSAIDHALGHSSTGARAPANDTGPTNAKASDAGADAADTANANANAKAATTGVDTAATRVVCF